MLQHSTAVPRDDQGNDVSHEPRMQVASVSLRNGRGTNGLADLPWRSLDKIRLDFREPECVHNLPTLSASIPVLLRVRVVTEGRKSLNACIRIRAKCIAANIQVNGSLQAIATPSQYPPSSSSERPPAETSARYWAISLSAEVKLIAMGKRVSTGLRQWKGFTHQFTD
jgi:hypothetical protein